MHDRGRNLDNLFPSVGRYSDEKNVAEDVLMKIKILILFFSDYVGFVNVTTHL